MWTTKRKEEHSARIKKNWKDGKLIKKKEIMKSYVMWFIAFQKLCGQQEGRKNIVQEYKNTEKAEN